MDNDGSVVLILLFLASYCLSVPVDPSWLVPKPYSFGYKIKDKFGEQHREESGDGKGFVQGTYGFVDARGIKRKVHYIADKLGFRAKIITNEPGTANQHPAGVIMESTQG